MDATFFNELNPLEQTLIGTFFTWLIAAVGASTVFFTARINMKFFQALLGFEMGIMLSASFFSLLLPSITQSSQSSDMPYWIPVVIGFMFEALVI